MKLITGLMFAVLLASCSEESHEPNDTNRQIEIEHRFERLPKDVAVVECGYDGPEKTLCEWLATIDQVVEVEVTEISIVDSPSWAEGYQSMVESCDSRPRWVLEVDAVVVDPILGSLTSGTSIKMRYPKFRVEDWDPWIANDGGQIRWNSRSSDMASRGIGIGSRFVAPLIHADDFFAIGPHLAMEEVDGRLQFQESSNECLKGYLPMSTLPNSKDDLRTEGVACASIGSKPIGVLREEYLPTCADFPAGVR